MQKLRNTYRIFNGCIKTANKSVNVSGHYHSTDDDVDYDDDD